MIRRKRAFSALAAVLALGLVVLTYLMGPTTQAAGEGPAAEAPLHTPSAPVLAGSSLAAQPTEEPVEEFFTITLLGDCTFSSGLYNDGLGSSYPNVVGDDYAYPFAQTADIFAGDDFTIANLECALTDSTSPAIKNFVFKADPAYANILTEGGVEFVTLGNNHVLDYGEEGYADTRAALDAVGVAYAGRDEWALYETESGLTIGVYATSFGETVQIQAGIAALKEAGAEFIIAALHWGDEGAYTVNDMQRSQGHAAIDAGADLVYGSHPHTLQPVEEYNGKYIYYSMGNWSFGGNTNPRDKDTAIVQLTLRRYGDEVTVVERTHIPAACSGEDPGNNYQPVLYEEGSEAYARTLSKLDGTFTGSNLTVNYDYPFSEY